MDLNELQRKITDEAEHKAMKKLEAACAAFVAELSQVGVSGNAAVLSAVLYKTNGPQPIALWQFIQELPRLFFDAARDEIHRQAINAFWHDHKEAATELETWKRECADREEAFEKLLRAARTCSARCIGQETSCERFVSESLEPVLKQYEHL